MKKISKIESVPSSRPRKPNYLEIDESLIATKLLINGATGSSNDDVSERIANEHDVFWDGNVIICFVC